MSKEYEGQDPIALAQQAERDLNSSSAKQGSKDSQADSGINEAAVNKFPGASVQVGSTGQGDNREISLEEGGDVLKNGQTTKAKDFEGRGGPEDKEWEAREVRGGDDDVKGNVRQGGETRRP